MSFVPIIYHIPHASTHIPEDIKVEFCLTEEELKKEILLMTDHYTDRLFVGRAGPQDIIVEFPVSRLVLDPERFSQDVDEPMAKVGMGVIYLKRHNGEQLRETILSRQNLLNRFYYPHHKILEAGVFQLVAEHKRALIIDCHSYPLIPLPYELNKLGERPQICLGADPYHTPAYLLEEFKHRFEEAGFSVGINTPFSGTFVPTQFLGKNASVLSIMIEVRRDVYMDETLGHPNKNFEQIADSIATIIADVRDTLMDVKI